MPTTALMAIPNMIPKMSSVTVSFTFHATDKIMNKIKAAPSMAAKMMEMLLKTVTPKMLPALNITIATKRLEPAETPSISGPATGLRKNVCISNPATGSAAPTRTAVIALGKRVCKIMIEVVSSLLVLLKRIAKISEKEILTDPMKISMRKKHKTITPSNKKTMLCFLFFNAVVYSKQTHAPS